MLSTTLKELRSKKGATQDDMATLLNIKRQTYSVYERGVSLPDVTALIKIAEYFNVSVDDLLETKKRSPVNEQPLSKEMQLLIDSYSDLSEDELKKVIEYVDFLKSKRTP